MPHINHMTTSDVHHIDVLEKGPIMLHFTPNHVSVGSKANIITVRHEKDVLLIDEEEIDA